MNIIDIYKKYDIIKNLEEHMLRVTGVGYLVAKNWKSNVDLDLTVAACLLHDMGNITKFNFDKPTVEIDNVGNWKNIQRKYWDKYGRDTHSATVQIIKELGRDDVVDVIEEEVDVFGKSIEITKEVSIPAIILLYSDMRVMPHGVTSMQERINDLQTRYSNSKYDLSSLDQVEEYLQEMTTIDIQSIDEEMVKPLFPEFLSVTI